MAFLYWLYYSCTGYFISDRILSDGNIRVIRLLRSKEAIFIIMIFYKIPRIKLLNGLKHLDETYLEDGRQSPDFVLIRHRNFHTKGLLWRIFGKYI